MQPTPRTSVTPTLHLVCGKIASGKSTLTTRLASAPHTVRISEDSLLAQLYPGQIASLADYAACAAQLRAAIAPLALQMLQAGVSVVLDFPANTPASRAWMRELFQQAGTPHVLHYLDVPDEECKARLRQRNASGLHPFSTSDAQFDDITRHFVPPQASEGFDIVRIAA
ncbi:AAA family ATPase [Janthinobacterium lividum]|uniref:ATP-binding protein n=1 Tax=Janthinobacterium lividum TaxID=29581 RepID=A0ABU0XPL5_9BURK|nr:ATP-binding protein [Janthinobacterium lividum]MDQ4625455.1 ATP-binding protein [Janthinobacterium lividum]MDQ4672942.1 ATP-binding protein [Janthinobacterium lividum]MDQ4683670.1 ATP-binding protein [Janthinobacterium lividum]